MKVFFADNFADKAEYILLHAGVRYRLISFYEVARRSRARLSPEVLAYWEQYRRIIVDSGLFTFMFGAESQNEMTPEFAKSWQDEYVTWINAVGLPNMDYVELDVQKKLGPKEAWEFRRELRARVRKGTIINVYHLEDGSPDALIDYSDYIAVSIPELRLNVSMKERERIVSYISRRALGKGKRVHLLGCTEKRHLVAFRNCTSCDSTSFTSSCRWGRLVTRKGSMSCTSAHAQESGPADWPWGKSLYWGVVHGLAMYIQTAGRQD